MNPVLTSLRLIAATMLVCCIAYPALLLAFAQGVFPHSANGQLLHSPDGTLAGCRQIAQQFTSPRYFWPRPSAVDYNGAAAGGSNKAPTNPLLADRARESIMQHGANAARPLPADLATASGSGLDPHISEAAALFQVERVAAARGVEVDGVRVRLLVEEMAFAPGGALASARVVNVLELNLALDRISSSRD